MSISLEKGQKVSLSKEHAGLDKIMLGLGWDEVSKNNKKGGFKALLSNMATQSVDCDASAILLTDNKYASKQDIVYYGNLRHNSKSVVHQGDNLTGAGEGDDEQIMIQLSKVPSTYNKIVIIVNIFQAVTKRQHFGMLTNAFIRLVDCRNNTEICKYQLTEQYDGMTAMIFGEVYRDHGEWKFTALGQATKDPDISALCKRFM